MTSDDDIRLVRARGAAQVAALADADKAGHSVARSFVGRVFRGIHPPTGNDKFVLTYRCQLSGTEVEDSPVGVAALTEAGIPVAVLGAVPDAGRNLIAHLVDGLWAAAVRGAGCREPNTIRVRVIHQCDGAPVAGARVKIYRALTGAQYPPFGCGGTLVLDTTTDGAGIAEYTPYVPFAHYCVHVEYDWSGGTCIGEFDFFDATSCVARELLLIACAGRMVVTVTDRDAGTPLSGVTIGVGGTLADPRGFYCLPQTSLGWVEAPTGTYTMEMCNRFVPFVGGCVDHGCPIPFAWDVSKPGYLNCCGVDSFTCDSVKTWATSLQAVEPNWVLYTNPISGHPCCEGACDPFTTVNCGPRGRVIKKQLYVILTAADPRVFGTNNGVPILLTWDAAKSRWDSGCLPGDGSTYRCVHGSDFVDKPWKSVRATMTCTDNGGYVGNYQKWGTVTDCGGAFGTGVGATECPAGYAFAAGYYSLEFGRMTGSICNPASASGYARDLGQLGFPVVGSSEVLE